MAKGKPSPRKTANQIEYDKELKRIQRLIKKLDKEGIKIPASVVPEMPKRVTRKALNEIREFKPSKLKEIAQSIANESGNVDTKQAKVTTEQVDDYAGKPRTKSTRKRKKAGSKTKATRQTDNGEVALPRESDMVINRIVDIMQEWPPEAIKIVLQMIADWPLDMFRPGTAMYDMKKMDRDALESVLNGILNSEDRNELAKRVQNNADQIVNLATEILYSSKQEWLGGNMARFITILIGREINTGESVSIQLEFATQEESYEDVYE